MLCAGQHGLENALQVVAVLFQPPSLTIWNNEDSFLCIVGIVGDLNVLMMHTRGTYIILGLGPYLHPQHSVSQFCRTGARVFAKMGRLQLNLDGFCTIYSTF